MNEKRERSTTRKAKKRIRAAQGEVDGLSQRRLTRFLKGLKLHEITLDSGAFRIDQGQWWHMLHAEKKRVNRLNVDTEIDSTWETDTGEYWFEAIATCSFGIIDPEDEAEIAVIDCTIRGHFQTSERNEGAIEAFTKTQFRIIVWPYFRQYVAAISAQAGIGSITIPLTTESIFKNLLEDSEDQDNS